MKALSIISKFFVTHQKNQKRNCLNENDTEMLKLTLYNIQINISQPNTTAVLFRNFMFVSKCRPSSVQKCPVLLHGYCRTYSVCFRSMPTSLEQGELGYLTRNCTAQEMYLVIRNYEDIMPIKYLQPLEREETPFLLTSKNNFTEIWNTCGAL